MGRRSNYTPELARHICEQLANGRALRDICRDEGMPGESTVQQWALRDRDGFAARYRSVRRRGKPSHYTQDIADRICDQLCKGRSLHDICRDDGMPPRATVSWWVKLDHKGFAAPYRRAREFGYFALIDEILEIADDNRDDWIVRRKADGSRRPVFDRDHVARARLRIEARCGLLGLALPKTIG